MPAAFVSVLAALGQANACNATLLLTTFAVTNLVFGFYDVSVYRSTYQ